MRVPDKQVLHNQLLLEIRREKWGAIHEVVPLFLALVIPGGVHLPSMGLSVRNRYCNLLKHYDACSEHVLIGEVLLQADLSALLLSFLSYFHASLHDFRNCSNVYSWLALLLVDPMSLRLRPS